MAAQPRRGSAATIIVILLAVVAFGIGAFAALALGGHKQAPLPATDVAPATFSVGGGGGAGLATGARPAGDYQWLPRSENILALSQTGANSTGTSSGGTVPVNTPSPMGSTTNLPQTNIPDFQTVPEVVGQSYEEAKDTVQAAKLNLDLKDSRYNGSVPEGRIATQFPDPGKSVAAGSTVSVTKSLGPAPKPKPAPTRTTPRRKRTAKRSSGGGCSGNCKRCHPNR